MPVISWAHSKYWRARANPVVIAPPTKGGYPAWQASVIGSLFGGLQLHWERFRYAWSWFLSAWRWSQQSDGCERDWLLEQWGQLSPDRRLALRSAISVVQHPAWAIAQASVHETAHTLGFNEHQAWAIVGHAVKANRGMAENMWRHLKALQAVQDAVGTNPERHLLIELAYHEYAASGRGRPPRMA